MHTQILTSKFGAELISFKLDGEERLHQGEEVIDKNGKVIWKRRFPVLFPTVRKCKKTQPRMKSNPSEVATHGFAQDCEFEPITKLDNFHSYVLRSNEKSLEKYPYKFSLYVTYRLDANKLTVIYKVINEDEVDMPFGIGSLPAIKIDYEQLKNNNYYLEFEEDENKIHFLYLIDGLVGTEYARNINAIIMKGLKSKKVALKRKDKGKVMELDYTGFPYLTVWSKPNAPFICITPWMSLPDTVKGTGVFRQKSDIIILAPKGEFECKYSITFY